MSVAHSVFYFRHDALEYMCLSVTQSSLTLCDPMDYSPPGSSVHGILQNTEVDSRSFLQGIFQPMD